MNRIGKIVLGLIAGIMISAVAFAGNEKYIPEDTETFFYVKDPMNLETRLAEKGLLSMSAEYRDMLLTYVGADLKLISLYQQFKEMDDGSFFKSLLGEVMFIRTMNENLVVIKVAKTSVLYTQLMKVMETGLQFGGYFVSIIDDTIVLSKSKSVLEYYKNNIKNKVNKDIVLLAQLTNNSDVIAYKKGDTVIEPFLDDLFIGTEGKRSLSIGLNIDARIVTALTSPTADPMAKVVRDAKFASFVPVRALAYVEVNYHPANLLTRALEEQTMKNVLQPFNAAFEPQTGIALLEMNTNLAPSFLVIMKAKAGQKALAESTMKSFITNVLGESGINMESSGNQQLWVGAKTGLAITTVGDYFLISDSKTAVIDAVSVGSGKSASVASSSAAEGWKAFAGKPGAVLIDFDKISRQAYKAAAAMMGLDATGKEDMYTYMTALQKLGLGLGTAANTDKYNCYILNLKQLNTAPIEK